MSMRKETRSHQAESLDYVLWFSLSKSSLYFSSSLNDFSRTFSWKSSRNMSFLSSYCTDDDCREFLVRCIPTFLLLRLIHWLTLSRQTPMISYIRDETAWRPSTHVNLSNTLCPFLFSKRAISDTLLRQWTLVVGSYFIHEGLHT
jgi:hypothetical protein